MATKLEVAAVLRMLALAYPRYELTNDIVEVYYKLLRDLDGDLLKAAALECATASAFFPSVHELRQAAAAITRLAARAPSSAEAWAEILSAPADGFHRRLTGEQDSEGRWLIELREHRFSHPLVQRVALNLGYPSRFWTDNLAADRARFMSAYESEIQAETAAARRLPEVTEFIDRRFGAAAIQSLLEGKS